VVPVGGRREQKGMRTQQDNRDEREHRRKNKNDSTQLLKDSVVLVGGRFHTPFEDSVVLSTKKNLRLELTTTPLQNPLNHAPSHTKDLNCKIYIQKIKNRKF
jgi:hypothetical protein